MKLKLPVIIPVGAGHARDSLDYAIQIFPSKLSFVRLYPACCPNLAHRNLDCAVTAIMTVFTACRSGADFVAWADAIKDSADFMTTVQIILPDELAQTAANAGLLSPQAMETMLREQLRRRAGEALHATWQRMPPEELTPEIEQEILEEVHRVRVERRTRGAS